MDTWWRGGSEEVIFRDGASRGEEKMNPEDHPSNGQSGPRRRKGQKRTDEMMLDKTKREERRWKLEERHDAGVES